VPTSFEIVSASIIASYVILWAGKETLSKIDGDHWHLLADKGYFMSFLRKVEAGWGRRMVVGYIS
jgi:hypothetical protein